MQYWSGENQAYLFWYSCWSFLGHRKQRWCRGDKQRLLYVHARCQWPADRTSSIFQENPSRSFEHLAFPPLCKSYGCCHALLSKQPPKQQETGVDLVEKVLAVVFIAVVFIWAPNDSLKGSKILFRVWFFSMPWCQVFPNSIYWVNWEGMKQYGHTQQNC